MVSTLSTNQCIATFDKGLAAFHQQSPQADLDDEPGRKVCGGARASFV